LSNGSSVLDASSHGSSDEQAHQDQARDHQQESDADASTKGTQNKLCAFDLAFGQVLGGVHGAGAPQIAFVLPTVINVFVFNPRLGSEAVPAQSRGPPLYL
ncbi:MAG TPA: hypothetical protein VK642_06020, partial [Burkholderiales bacterium]|nr:hypothetical protein [Burkholderiales bacterium]